MLTDVAGVRVGHWSDHEARTGCTVVLLPEGTSASGEVRGGAPATREFALLEPHRLVDRVHAVVLSGGSSFGLAAGDGVVRWLEQAGVGYPTAGGIVPIVVGMSLFDLMVGDPSVRPGPDQGYAACASATGGAVPTGAVGAGAGAMVGNWRGLEGARPGGLGTASARAGEVVVSALIAVNAFGDVDLGGATDAFDEQLQAWAAAGDGRPIGPTNTTIGVIVTNARLDKGECLVLAQGGHDGYARALFPPHTRLDGDALVAAATGAVPADADVVRALGVRAVEQAIRSLA